MKLSLPRFVFINGPARSGKSTLAKLICDSNPSAWRESFAEPIREMLRAVFFPEDSLIEGPDRIDFRDGAIKKQAILKLAGIPLPEDVGIAQHYIPVRQVMIDFSETFMKPRFGVDIFGRLLWKRCEEQSHWYSSFIIDDSGFESEARFIASQVGPERCYLIRLHRKGHDFAGDSRSYIDLSPVPFMDLVNDGAAAEMLHALQLEFGTL